MIVWFHSIPDGPEVVNDSQLFEQINVSAFKPARKKESARKLFHGDFNGFVDYVTTNDSFDNVEVILPAKEVIYTQVSVPSKSRSRIMQALPFMLDDGLINNVNEQYFALGDIKSGQCNIAILNRFLINKVFEQFKKLSLPVSVMTSELFQLPWYPDKWTITLLQDNIFIRTGPQSGMTVSDNNIDFIFHVLLNNCLPEQAMKHKDEPASSTDNTSSEQNITQTPGNPDSDKPDSIIIYAQENTQLVEDIKTIAQKYSIDTEVVKGDLLKFALSENKTDIKNQASGRNWGINLLQGEFHPGRINPVKIPFLKSMLSVMVIGLFSQIFFMGYQWHLYQNNQIELEKELEQLFFKTFPDAKRLVDVRSQTESKLEQLQKNSSANDSFLNLLGLVGDEINHFKGINIQTLHYNEGILQLEILSKGFVFNQLKTSLQSKYGLLVEEKSSSRIKGEVHSVINFRMNNR